MNKLKCCFNNYRNNTSTKKSAALYTYTVYENRFVKAYKTILHYLNTFIFKYTTLPSFFF